MLIVSNVLEVPASQRQIPDFTGDYAKVYDGGDFEWWDVANCCPLGGKDMLVPTKVDGRVYGEVYLRGEKVYGANANLPFWKEWMQFRGLPVHRAVDAGQPVGTGAVPVQEVSLVAHSQLAVASGDSSYGSFSFASAVRRMTTTVDSTDESGAGLGVETARKEGSGEPVSMAVVEPERTNGISSNSTWGGSTNSVEGD